MIGISQSKAMVGKLSNFLTMSYHRYEAPMTQSGPTAEFPFHSLDTHIQKRHIYKFKYLIGAGIGPETSALKATYFCDQKTLKKLNKFII